MGMVEVPCLTYHGALLETLALAKIIAPIITEHASSKHITARSE
jgi:hypothetical protein